MENQADVTKVHGGPEPAYHRAVLQHVSLMSPDVSIRSAKHHQAAIEAFGKASDLAVESAASPYGLPWVVRLRSEDGFADVGADITELGPVVSIRVHGDKRRASRLYFNALKVVAPLKPMQDGNPMIGAPLACRGKSGVEDLVRTITAPGRTVPIVAVSLPEQAYGSSAATVNPQFLAAALRGLARVYVIAGPDTYALTSLLGKPWSVFKGAVRVYWPGCSPSEESPLDHPLTTASAIERWRGGVDGYVGSLIAMIHSASLKFAPRTNLLPPTFGDLSSGPVAAPPRKSKPKVRSKAPGGPKRSLTDLVDWAKQFDEHLVVTPRAARSLKGSPFAEPDLVYEAIELMGTHYARMRLNGGSRNIELFERGLRALQMENERTGDATTVQNNPLFTVDVDGRRHTLDWHLKRSNSRDPAHCFRLYYTWCDATDRVIVGSLPGHLRTAAS